MNFETYVNQLRDNLVYISLVFSSTFLVFQVIRLVIIKRLSNLTKKTKYSFDDLIISIVASLNSFFYLVLSFYIATRFIRVKEGEGTIKWFYIAFFSFYAIKAVTSIVNYIGDQYIKKEKTKDENTDTSVIKVLTVLVKVTIWLIAAIFLLQNAGVNVSAVVAALGVGGIAVGFALQSVLTDLFAYFSIFFDKPFKVGDFIAFEEKSGKVEKIGIKTTRVKTLQGEQLVVPNTMLTESGVNNFKKLKARRVFFDIGITYQTPYEKVKDIPKIVAECIKNIDLVIFIRAHFKEYGDSALIFEVVFDVNSEDYIVYMDKRQQVNLNILKEFEKNKINFAYPTQTLFIEK